VPAWFVVPWLAGLAADAGAQPAGTLAGRVARARAGEVIELPPGVYRPGTLRFRHSGEPGRPIVLRAAEPGTVVIRGSREVRSWQRLPGDAPVYRRAGWRIYFPPRDPPGNSSTSDAR